MGTKDTGFYENIPGLRTPCKVEAVKLDLESKSVEVTVKCQAGTLWAGEPGQHSRTLLYERFAIEALPACRSVRAAAEPLRLSWDEWQTNREARPGAAGVA